MASMDKQSRQIASAFARLVAQNLGCKAEYRWIPSMTVGLHIDEAIIGLRFDMQNTWVGADGKPDPQIFNIIMEFYETKIVAQYFNKRHIFELADPNTSPENVAKWFRNKHASFMMGNRPEYDDPNTPEGKTWLKEWNS